MTSSEKAIQILEQYANLEYRLSDYDFPLRIESGHKEQAMICLDEILKDKINLLKTKIEKKMIKNSLEFWLDVQKTIRKY